MSTRGIETIALADNSTDNGLGSMVPSQSVLKGKRNYNSRSEKVPVLGIPSKKSN